MLDLRPVYSMQIYAYRVLNAQPIGTLLELLQTLNFFCVVIIFIFTGIVC